MEAPRMNNSRRIELRGDGDGGDGDGGDGDDGDGGGDGVVEACGHAPLTHTHPLHCHGVRQF